MIVNPNKHPQLLVPYAGTRSLQQDFGLLGEVVDDPFEKGRVWRIDGVYAPVRCRATQGIRVKVYDQLGFMSFIEQMPLEVLLGVGEPGQRCQWSGKTYPQVEDRDRFFAFNLDTYDMQDDLLDIETAARGRPDVVLPDGSWVERKLHMDWYDDFIEGWTLIWDGDPETGVSPDLRLETVATRWQRVEQRRVQWAAEYKDSQHGEVLNYRQWRSQQSSTPAGSAASARRRSTTPTRSMR